MQTDRPLDGIDSRFALIVYAAVMWVIGVFIFGWGIAWMRDMAIGLAPTREATGRLVFALNPMVGVVSMALASIATASARASDPVDRSRCLGGLALGHLAITVMALLQTRPLLADPLSGRLFVVLAIPAMWLVYSWQRRDGDGPRGFLPMLRFRRAANVQLRASYEEHVRTAAVQEERNRLARDLHDAIKQQLFVVQTAAATAQARLDSDSSGTSAALGQIRESTRDALTEMDTMLDQLRAAPLENTGLIAALKKLAEATSLRTGVDVRCEFGALPPSEAFTPGVHADLLRIAQEALSNVARHARATQVAITLGMDGSELALRITDNGKGFTETAKHGGMGLRNMRERSEHVGGGLSISSLAGKGTEIVVALPIVMSRRSNFSRKLIVATVLVTCWALLLLATATNGNKGGSKSALLLLPLAVASVFDLVRYTLAWRKTRRLPVTSA